MDRTSLNTLKAGYQGKRKPPNVFTGKSFIIRSSSWQGKCYEMDLILSRLEHFYEKFNIKDHEEKKLHKLYNKNKEILDESIRRKIKLGDPKETAKHFTENYETFMKIIDKKEKEIKKNTGYDLTFHSRDLFGKDGGLNKRKADIEKHVRANKGLQEVKLAILRKFSYWHNVCRSMGVFYMAMKRVYFKIDKRFPKKGKMRSLWKKNEHILVGVEEGLKKDKLLIAEKTPIFEKNRKTFADIYETNDANIKKITKRTVKQHSVEFFKRRSTAVCKK